MGFFLYYTIHSYRINDKYFSLETQTWKYFS